MRHHLLTLAFLGAAAALYYFGQRDGAALLILAGGLAELVVWKRVLRKRKGV